MEVGRARDVLIAYDSEPGIRSQIYLGVKLRGDLEYYIRVVDGLANGEANNVEFADPDRVWLEGLDSLVLNLGQNGESDVTVVEERGRTTCKWTCTPEEWRLAGDMLRVLNNHGRPGFQYLPPDRAETEIEFDYGGHPGSQA